MTVDNCQLLARLLAGHKLHVDVEVAFVTIFEVLIPQIHWWGARGACPMAVQICSCCYSRTINLATLRGCGPSAPHLVHHHSLICSAQTTALTFTL